MERTKTKVKRKPFVTIKYTNGEPYLCLSNNAKARELLLAWLSIKQAYTTQLKKITITPNLMKVYYYDGIHLLVVAKAWIGKRI